MSAQNKKEKIPTKEPKKEVAVGKEETIEIRELGRMLMKPKFYIEGVIREEKLPPGYKITIKKLEELLKKYYGE